MSVRIAACARPDPDELRPILLDYTRYYLGEFNILSGRDFRAEDAVAGALSRLDRCVPPKGHTFLARNEAGGLIGTCFVKSIGPDMAEIKRLYVRPEMRGAGVGRHLVDRAIAAARTDGCRTVRLDTGVFMTGPIAMYRALGFREIAPYPESENDPALYPWICFMELVLGRTMRGVRLRPGFAKGHPPCALPHWPMAASAGSSPST